MPTKNIDLGFDSDGELASRVTELDPESATPETVTETWTYEGGWVEIHWDYNRPGGGKGWRVPPGGGRMTPK